MNNLIKYIIKVIGLFYYMLSPITLSAQEISQVGVSNPDTMSDTVTKVEAKQNSAVVPYLTTDLTSAYLWRGQRLAGVSIQPVLGLKWKWLNFFFWGNTQVAPPAEERPIKYERDIFLKCQVTKNLSIALKDVYTTTRGNGFFSWGEIG